MYHAIYRFNKDEEPDFSNATALLDITGEEFYELGDKDLTNSYDYYVTSLDRLFNESRAVKANWFKQKQ